MEFTAESLNRECACISLDAGALRARLDQGAPEADLYASILAQQPHLFASVPVFVARRHVDAMGDIVRAVEAAVHTPGYREAALADAPPIAQHGFGPLGVFYGYDFHLGDDGPKLIEINTNAGGGLLNAVLARAQRACCEELKGLLPSHDSLDAVQQAFVAMFRHEWALQRGAAPLRSVAIVDESPSTQYLYPEFLLFQDLLRRAGLQVVIAAPEELRFDGSLRVGDTAIDLVYNRLTDFYLEAEPHVALRKAYELGAVVLTPHPQGHALYSDKRRLAWLSDEARLQRLGVAPGVSEVLIQGVPQSVLVDEQNRAALWASRKRLFFKPTRGYGGKAAYRGDKLTTRTWADMAGREYIAQDLVKPSERTIVVEGQRVPLKLDLRVYVYEGQAQLLAARLYQGQTTNFRTPGGGFAPVFTEE
ncbi:MAG: hypothetical protein JWN04_1764 [Myxococcaceae bacterium]|nr:hypothetical protein [Myxococcaceae bacterium]